jgi:hypothetical protein
MSVASKLIDKLVDDKNIQELAKHGDADLLEGTYYISVSPEGVKLILKDALSDMPEFDKFARRSHPVVKTSGSVISFEWKK